MAEGESAPAAPAATGLLSSATPAPEAAPPAADPASVVVGDQNTPHPATGTPAPQPNGEAKPAPAQKAARPEWLLEQHWDPDKAEPRLESLAKSHKDAVAEIGRLKLGKEPPPEKPEGYLEDFKVAQPRNPDGTFGKLERVGDIPADDPALKAFAEVAHKAGIGKAAFGTLVSDFLAKLNPLLPEPFDMDREIGLLGGPEKGKLLVNGTRAWIDTLKARGILNEDEHTFALGFGDTALGVRTLAKLREAAGEAPIPLGRPVTAGIPSKDEAYAMMGDPLYTDPSPKGDAYRAKVAKVFEDTFGTAPATSSSQLQAGGA